MRKDQELFAEALFGLRTELKEVNDKEFCIVEEAPSPRDNLHIADILRPFSRVLATVDTWSEKVQRAVGVNLRSNWNGSRRRAS